ncbi:hypothetical protein PybrP1_005475 [[Pythium] brassicae (nom. inval.)]|nr:hypothetical protein PybrP1_005475 [[Pythium] brassicae (nom. inval.)]
MPELHVRAVCARNLLDKQTFGKQDPYCKITVRNRTFKTRVHDNGDKAPVWNERFTFETYDPQLDQLRIEVLDKNFTASTLIGEVYLPVNMFVHGNVVDEWYTLNNGKKRAGEINLRIQFVGAGVEPAKAAKTTNVAYAQPQPQAYAVPQQATAYPAAPQPVYAQQQAYPVQQQQHYPPPQQHYPPPPQHYPPQQQHYPPPQQQAYPPQQQQQHYPPPPQHYPPPPQGYGYPPPPMMVPAPVLYGAPPPPVVYGAPATVVYGGGHHKRRGGDGAEIAMGVGAGLLGGMILGDVLFD